MVITICAVVQDEMETAISGIRIHHCDCNSFMTSRRNPVDEWCELKCSCGLAIGLSPNGVTLLKVAAITEVDRDIPERDFRCETCDTLLVRGGCVDNGG